MQESDPRVRRTQSYPVLRVPIITKALTGGFRVSITSVFTCVGFPMVTQEAADAVLELHDDDPEHFDYFLKFIYNSDYDYDAPEKLADGDPAKLAAILVGLHALVDKYDVPKICFILKLSLKSSLDMHGGDNESALSRAAVRARYGHYSEVKPAIGKLKTSAVLSHNQKFYNTPICERLMQEYPAFAADIAFTARRKRNLNLFVYRCDMCDHRSRFDIEKLREEVYVWFHCEGWSSFHPTFTVYTAEKAASWKKTSARLLANTVSLDPGL